MKLEKELVLAINEVAEYLMKKGVIAEHKDLTEYESKAIRFLKEKELIKPSPNSNFQYHATPEISEINELGIEKYLKKKNKSKPYNEPWIGYLIAFITLILAFYQWNESKNFEKGFSSLNKSLDSLNIEVSFLKKKHDSLNIQYVFLESQLSDLKKEIEQKK